LVRRLAAQQQCGGAAATAAVGSGGGGGARAVSTGTAVPVGQGSLQGLQYM
jgi:hypothetical protein